MQHAGPTCPSGVSGHSSCSQTQGVSGVTKMADDGFAPWSMTTAQVLSHLDVDPKTGLTDQKVEEKRATYGYNELEKESKQSIWAMIVEQFEDTLVRVSTRR